MSLLQAIITDNYAMLCSDTKAYKLNGEYTDHSVKIARISDTVMFGCTGKVQDNYTLFSEYCDCDGIKYIPKYISDDISYNEVIEYLTIQYDNMEEQFQSGTPYEICSMVCGYNEDLDDFEVTIFALHTNHNIKNGMYTFRKLPQTPYRIFTCGNLQHEVELANLADDVYMQNDGLLSVRQWKNMFMNVLQIGGKYDYTINNKPKFAIIRKRIDNDKPRFTCKIS